MRDWCAPSGPASGNTVDTLVFILVEAFLIGFFVFGYILFRRRRAGRDRNGG